MESYKGKVLFLRCLCGDAKLDFAADGTLKQTCRRPVPFTLAGLSIKEMKIKGGALEIKADRMGLQLGPSNDLKNESNNAMHQVSLKQSLTLTISGAATAQSAEDYTTALAAILATNYADLAPQLPSFWQSYISSAKDRPVFPLQPEPAGAPVAGKNGVSDPRLTYSVEPSFTKEARKLRAEGVCILLLVVSADGLPTKIHILRPVGLGLDEQAVGAVEKYRFKPAEKDGRPVPVRIAIEVRFHMY